MTTCITIFQFNSCKSFVFSYFYLDLNFTLIGIFVKYLNLDLRNALTLADQTQNLPICQSPHYNLLNSSALVLDYLSYQQIYTSFAKKVCYYSFCQWKAISDHHHAQFF